MVQTLEEEGKAFDFKDSRLPRILKEHTSCKSEWFTYNNGVVVCVLLLGGICSLFIYRVLCDP